MKKIEVFNLQNVCTNRAIIADNEVDAFLEQHSHTFGLPERPELTEMGEPTGIILPAEYTIQITDVTALIQQERERKEALEYLMATDFYIIREMDAGTPCPPEIKAARAAARLKA